MKISKNDVIILNYGGANNVNKNVNLFSNKFLMCMIYGSTHCDIYKYTSNNQTNENMDCDTLQMEYVIHDIKTESDKFCTVKSDNHKDYAFCGNGNLRSGDIITLKHRISNMFLCIDETGNKEKSLNVTHKYDNDITCWWKIELSNSLNWDDTELLNKSNIQLLNLNTLMHLNINENTNSVECSFERHWWNVTLIYKDISKLNQDFIRFYDHVKIFIENKNLVYCDSNDSILVKENCSNYNIWQIIGMETSPIKSDVFINNKLNLTHETKYNLKNIMNNKIMYVFRKGDKCKNHRQIFLQDYNVSEDIVKASFKSQSIENNYESDFVSYSREFNITDDVDENLMTHYSNLNEGFNEMPVIREECPFFKPCSVRFQKLSCFELKLAYATLQTNKCLKLLNNILMEHTENNGKNEFKKTQIQNVSLIGPILVRQNSYINKFIEYIKYEKIVDANDEQNERYRKMKLDFVFKYELNNLVILTIDRLSTFEGIECDNESNINILIKRLIRLLIACTNVESASLFVDEVYFNWLINWIENTIHKYEDCIDLFILLMDTSKEFFKNINKEAISRFIKIFLLHGYRNSIFEILKRMCIKKHVIYRTNQYYINKCIINHLIFPKIEFANTIYTKKINIALLNILKSSCYRKIYYEVRINEIVKTKNCNSKDGFFFRVGWASEEHFIPHYYSGSNNNDLAIGDSFYSCGFDGNNIWIGGNSIQIKDIKELHNNSTIGVYLNLDNKIIKFSIDGCIIEDFYINQLCNWTRLAPFISYSDNVKFTINYHNINTKNKDLSYLALNDISSIIELDSVLLLNNEIKFSKYITIENIARFSQNSHTIIQNFDLNNYSLSENINKLVQDLAIDLHNFWVINKIEQGWRYGKMNEQEKKHPSLISYLDTEKEHKNYHFNLSKNLIKLIFYAGFTISKQCSKLLKYGFVELHNGKINISMDTLNKYDIDQKPMHKKNEDKEKYIYLITDHIDLNKNLIILANIISEYLHNEWCHSQINDGWKYSSTNEYNTSEHLVPYKFLDTKIKIINCKRSKDIVKSIISRGYEIKLNVLKELNYLNTDSVSLLTKYSETYNYYRLVNEQSKTNGKWCYECKINSENCDLLIGFIYYENYIHNSIQFIYDNSILIDLKHKKIQKNNKTINHICGKFKTNDVIGCYINLDTPSPYIGFYHNYEVITLENQEKAITNINLKVGLKLKMLPIIIIGVGVSIDLILGSKKQNLLFMDKTIGYEMYQGYMKQTFEQPKIMKLCCTNQFIPIKKFENFTSIIYENQLDMEYKIQRNIVNIQSESHTCSVNGFLNNFEPMYIIRINVPVTIHLKNISRQRKQTKKDKYTSFIMGNMRSSLDEVTNSNDKKNNTNNKCHRSRSPFYKLLKFNSRNKKIKNRQYKSNSTSRISNVDKLNSVQPTKPDYVLEKRETNNHDSKHDKNTDMYGYQHIENIKKSKCIHYSVKIGETKFNINHIYVGWCAEEILNDYYENLNTIDIDNIILNNFSIYSEKSNKQYIKKGFYVMSLNDIIFATSNNGNCDNDFVIENGIKITCIVDIYSGEIKFSFNNITVASDCEIPNKIRILPVIISTNTCLQQSITFYHIDVKQSTDICKYYNYLYAKNIKPIKNTWPRAVYAEILNTMNWKYVPLHFDDLNYTTLTTFSNSQKCHINDLAEYQQHYLENWTNMINTYHISCSNLYYENILKVHQYINHQQCLHVIKKIISLDFNAALSLEYINLWKTMYLKIKSFIGYFILHNNVYICNGNGQFRSVKLNDIWNSTCNIEYSLHFELKDSIEFIKNNSEWVIENFVQLLSFDYSVNECYIKFFIEIISLMLYFELLNYHNIDIIIGTISKYKRINILLDSTKFALSELLLKIYKFKLKFIMKRILKFSIITVGHISTDQKVRHQKLKIGDMNFDHNIELYKEYRSSLFNQMKLCTNYYNNIYKTSTFNSLYKQLYTKSNETLMHYISIEFTEENKIFYECIDNLLSCIQLDKMNKNLVQNIYNLFYIRNNPFNEVVESLNALIIVDSKFEKDLYIIISSYLEIETMKNVKFDTFDLSKFTILIKNIQHSNIFYVQSIVLAKIGLIKTLVDIFSLSFDIYQEEFQQTKLSIQQRVCITICRFIYLYVSTNENNKSEMFEYISIFIDKFTFLSDAIGLKYGSLPIHVITEIFRNSLQLICHINQNMIEKFIYELSRNYNKNSIRHFGIPDHYNWNPISSLNYINFFIKTLQTKDGSLIEVYSDLVFKMIVKSTNIVNLISKRSNKNALLTSNDLYDDIIYYIHLSLKIIFRNRESFYMMLEIMSDDYSITQVIYRNLHDYTEHYIDNIDISNINIGLYSLKYYKLITEFILLIIKSNNKVVTNDVQKKLVVRNIIQLNTLSKILSTNYIILLANEVNEFNKTDEIQIITLKPDMKRSIFDLLTSLYKFETEETFFQVYDSCFLIDLRVAAFLSKEKKSIGKSISMLNNYVYTCIIPFLNIYSHHFSTSNFHYDKMKTNTLLYMCMIYESDENPIKNENIVLTCFQNLFRYMSELSSENLLIYILSQFEKKLSNNMYYKYVRILQLWYSNEDKNFCQHKSFIFFNCLLTKLKNKHQFFHEISDCLTSLLCRICIILKADIKFEFKNIQINWYFQYYNKSLKNNCSDLSRTHLSNYCTQIVNALCANKHHENVNTLILNGWKYDSEFNENKKKTFILKPYILIKEKNVKLIQVLESSIKYIYHIGWKIKGEEKYANIINNIIHQNKSKEHFSKSNMPIFINLSTIVLNDENKKMAFMIAKHLHNEWCQKLKDFIKNMANAFHQSLVDFELLTQNEIHKRYYMAFELMQFIQYTNHYLHDMKYNIDLNVDAPILKISNIKLSRKCFLNKNNFANLLIFHFDLYTIDLLCYLDALNQSCEYSIFVRRHLNYNYVSNVSSFFDIYVPLLCVFFENHKDYILNSNDSMKVIICRILSNLINIIRSYYFLVGHASNAIICLIERIFSCLSLNNHSVNCLEDVLIYEAVLWKRYLTFLANCVSQNSYSNDWISNSVYNFDINIYYIFEISIPLLMLILYKIYYNFSLFNEEKLKINLNSMLELMLRCTHYVHIFTDLKFIFITHKIKLAMCCGILSELYSVSQNCMKSSQNNIFKYNIFSDQRFMEYYNNLLLILAKSINFDYNTSMDLYITLPIICRHLKFVYSDKSIKISSRLRKETRNIFIAVLNCVQYNLMKNNDWILFATFQIKEIMEFSMNKNIIKIIFNLLRKIENIRNDYEITCENERLYQNISIKNLNYELFYHEYVYALYSVLNILYLHNNSDDTYVERLCIILIKTCTNWHQKNIIVQQEKSYMHLNNLLSYEGFDKKLSYIFHLNYTYNFDHSLKSPLVKITEFALNYIFNFSNTNDIKSSGQLEVLINFLENSKITNTKKKTKNTKFCMQYQRKKKIMMCFNTLPLYKSELWKKIYSFIHFYKIYLLGLVKENKDMIPYLTKSTNHLYLLNEYFNNVICNKNDTILPVIFNEMKNFCYNDEPDDDDDYECSDDSDNESLTDENEDKDEIMKELERLSLIKKQNLICDCFIIPPIIKHITLHNNLLDSDIVESCVDVSISILNDGNIYVQKCLLDFLEKNIKLKFPYAIHEIIDKFSKFELSNFYRSKTLDIMGVDNHDFNLHFIDKDFIITDYEFIIKIFRFLQLLCEGHNIGFQSYLRNQNCENSINLVTVTVSYMAKLQKSMMDLFNYYSTKSTIDIIGCESFKKCIAVSIQIFRTLTEYMQGPCTPNQESISNEIFWESMQGYNHIVANMQHKLSQMTNQNDLLKQILSLQKEYMIMLLSLLEGNKVNGKIGLKMVDMLKKSKKSVKKIIQFFDVFLKMHKICKSSVFKLSDENQDGIVTISEFHNTLIYERIYTQNEIEYIMCCINSDNDGIIDLQKLKERFYHPAKTIGFIFALLLKNLSEHLPNQPKLQMFTDSAHDLMNYFSPFLGTIEIIGVNGNIEIVYFEIKQTYMDQWIKPQIRDFKKDFLYAVSNNEGENEKIDFFVDFCENSIFQMQHTSKLYKKKIKYQKFKNQAISTVFIILARFMLYLSGINFEKNINLIYRCAYQGYLHIKIFFTQIYNFYEKRHIYSIHHFKFTNLRNYCFKVVYKIISILCGVIRRYYALMIKHTHLSAEYYNQYRHYSIDYGSCINFKSMLSFESIQYSENLTKKIKSAFIVEFIIYFCRFILILVGIATRNFFKMKIMRLGITFLINTFLLYIVVDTNDTQFRFEKNYEYLNGVIYSLKITHIFVSIGIIFAYYNLKIPLIIFVKEKDICHQMKFEGNWIIKNLKDDFSIKGFIAKIYYNFSKLAIRSKSFPSNYWDVFFKRTIYEQYLHTMDISKLKKILGITSDYESEKIHTNRFDWNYNVWKIGIVITDIPFLYNFVYLLFSLMGLYNSFFLSVHLLDIAICFKTVGTILKSVTHNIKQLLLTLLLTCIIVYFYTVIAFNYFRKYYLIETDKNKISICNGMFKCYIFNLYKGIRAGGGIGDELDQIGANDPIEYYRIIFDITFFFFVIIILLAIIQGLIIDAFGELRNQLEQVKTDMESACFICGIGKDYFDKIPQGFDNHVTKEHNFANYLFFIMHLINKSKTEYTGQESYVWTLYQKRCWDFFPLGDCFRKQYENELTN